MLLIGTGTITQLVDIEGEEDYVSSVAWIKEGNFLAVGVSDGSIQVSQPYWDRRTFLLKREVRVVKFKCPRVLGNQKMSEDNQELRPGCPPDYQIFCERIDPKNFIPTKTAV